MIVHTRFFQIAREIANRNGYTLEEVWEKHRNPSFVAVRREIAIALRAAGASYTEAGKVLQRDHTSVMNLVKGREQELPSRVRVAG